MFKHLVLSFLAATTVFAGKLDDALRSFEDNPGYSSPVATYMGTIQNTGLVHSAQVAKGFTWGMGLDFNLAFLSQDDVNYTWNRTTNCQTILNQKAEYESLGYTVGGSCDLKEKKTLPTIFGGSTQERLTQYGFSQVGNAADSTFVIEGDPSVNVNEGLFSDSDYEFLTRMMIMPLAYVQFGYEHTQAKIRGMYFGLSVGDNSFSTLFTGLSLQHDVGHYFTKPLPVDLSILSSWSTWGVNFESEDYTGSLSLDGLVHQYSIVVGKKWGVIELTSEIGYEISSFEASGEMVKKDDGETITPQVTVDGNNGFKVALNLSFDFGGYRLHTAQSLGAQRGNTINFINYESGAQ